MSNATEMLSLYLEAEKNALKGQRFRLENGGVLRDVTRQSLDEIRKGVVFWQKQVQQEQAAAAGNTSGTMRYRVPNFNPCCK